MRLAQSADIQNCWNGEMLGATNNYVSRMTSFASLSLLNPTKAA
jgi:hypothetical protein